MIGCSENKVPSAGRQAGREGTVTASVTGKQRLALRATQQRLHWPNLATRHIMSRAFHVESGRLGRHSSASSF